MYIRVNKTKNYTVMSNYHLQDKRLSFKAKGLLSVMLSLPNDWNYSIDGLNAISVENETAIKSTLNELKKFGYLVVTKLLPNQTNTGRIEYQYDIYEVPQEGKKQGLEFLGVEFLGLENHGQQITNNQYTDINNNMENTVETNSFNTGLSIVDTKNVRGDHRSQDRFSKPTVEQIAAYCRERNNGINAQHFFDFYESKGWKVGKSAMKDWKACIRTWEQRNGKNKNTEADDLPTYSVSTVFE